MRSVYRSILAAAGSCLVLAACDGGETVAPAPLTPSVTVSLERDTLVAFGETVQATAVVSNLDDYVLTWSSSDEDVASVDATGIVTGHTNGTAQIEATAGSATGNAVVVVQQQPAGIAFATEPSDGTGGTPLETQPVLEARDAEGNLLVGSGPTVSLALGTNPGGGTLSGITDLEFEEGIAAFSGLSIDRVGGGYTVVASLGAELTATSEPFDILLGPPSPDSSSVSLARPEALVDDTLTALVSLRDAGGNPFETGGNEVSIVTGEGTSAFEVVDVIDEGDGTYTAVLAATAPGTATVIRAMIDGEVTTGSDAQLRVFALQAILAGGWQALPDSTFGATCGLLDSGDLLCWGDGRFGNLGHGSFSSAEDPTLVADDHEWASASVGMFVTCGVRTDGSPFCWGSGSSGELGNGQSGGGSAANRSTPTAVQAPGGLAHVAASPFRGVCGIDLDDRALCWGPNAFGRLGTGDTEPHDVPTPVVGDLAFGSVALGIGHGCGITTDGVAYCWGNNLSGALGIGNEPPPDECGDVACALSPLEVLGELSFVPASITLADNLSCAIEEGTFAAYCWGSGPVGDGTQGPAREPTPVSGGLAFTQLSANDGYVCGVTTGGEIYCWGTNESGQLGNGTQAEALTPEPVDRSDDFVAVSAGPTYACALTARGSAYCWGRNDSHELGDGTTTARLSPTRVRMFR
jgi:hypothetical protein